MSLLLIYNCIAH